ncbi:MAG: hypothetical protein AB1416_08325 [Actinomycetota bacterium]
MASTSSMLARVAQAARAHARAQARADALLAERDGVIREALHAGEQGAAVARAAGVSMQRVTDIAKGRR